MQPSAATKEQQPVTSGENQIPVTHTENFDHELVANAKSELGDGVATPAKNLGPIQNPEALKHLLEVVNDVKPNTTESLIGEAGVRKDIPELPKKPAESFPKTVASTLSHLGEQMYHGYLKWRPSIRYNKSKDNLKKVEERAELLGQTLKDEVTHAPKKYEIPPEEPTASTPQQKEAVTSTPIAPEQAEAPAIATAQSEMTPPATLEQQQPQQNTAGENPMNETSLQPSTIPNEQSAQSQAVADTNPVDLNTYRQTGQIVPTAEQPAPSSAPQVPQQQAA